MSDTDGGSDRSDSFDCFEVKTAQSDKEGSFSCVSTQVKPDKDGGSDRSDSFDTFPTNLTDVWHRMIWQMSDTEVWGSKQLFWAVFNTFKGLLIGKPDTGVLKTEVWPDLTVLTHFRHIWGPKSVTSLGSFLGPFFSKTCWEVFRVFSQTRIRDTIISKNRRIWGGKVSKTCFGFDTGFCKTGVGFALVFLHVVKLHVFRHFYSVFTVIQPFNSHFWLFWPLLRSKTAVLSCFELFLTHLKAF